MAATRHWTGGANFPTQYARVNVSMPFAALSLDAGRLNLVVHFRFLAKFTNAQELSASPADITLCYPVRSRLGFRGVGIHAADGREYYFKSTAGAGVLSALADAGFPVSREMRKPSKLWQGVP